MGVSIIARDFEINVLATCVPMSFIIDSTVTEHRRHQNYVET